MRKCLSKEKLFDYFHAELEKSEMDLINAHINVCDDCRYILNQIETEVNLVKNTLDCLNPDVTRIPDFSKNKKYTFNKHNRRKILGWAASIGLLISFSTVVTQKIIDNQKPVNDYEYFKYIPDLNDAWKENSITVTSYDSKGNPINHQVITD